MIKLSVIIVNYNVKYFLEQTLLSVRKASGTIAVEVFVVDNNSVDGSVAMLKEKFPEVKLIANDTNQGFSKANNQAIREASGEYILLLNPDTVVEEDTFKKVLSFMDEHPEAGGLGVKMIDGSGKFLPESKRGLPIPIVAFYKVFGFSALFPKSRTFGRYHLGFLDKDKTHEVDILSGAFMLLRKTALDKVGLLDESFFMYGEDIDLSYRLIQGGYKNYYLPDTRIIHYKGESTKKSSINYVFVFYNAMIIFAKKHFSEKNASTFSVLINCAIYIRAAMAIFSRFCKRFFLPVLDFALLFLGIKLIKDIWESQVRSAEGIHYPELYMYVVVPIYIFIWLITVYFSGGYDSPLRRGKIVRGIVAGTIFILVIYALLPESYRFSRALIMLGSIWAIIAMDGLRMFLNSVGLQSLVPQAEKRKKLLIVAGKEEGERVLSLLELSQTLFNFIGFVNPQAGPAKESSNDKFYLGSIENLEEIIKINNANEVIFCAKDVSANQIIEKMSGLSSDSVEYKIAPPESLYIIGSNSIHNNGELYVIDINSINKPSNRRNKRVTDLGVSFLFMITWPVLLFMVKQPGTFIVNIFRVLAGKRTWVGYSGNGKTSQHPGLPKIKQGILSPLNANPQAHFDAITEERLNSLYAKDYEIYNDLFIIWRGIRELGRN